MKAITILFALSATFSFLNPTEPCSVSGWINGTGTCECYREEFYFGMKDGTQLKFSQVGYSGTVSFVQKKENAFGCPSCPKLLIQGMPKQTDYWHAIAGTGTWEGDTFTYEVTVQQKPTYGKFYGPTKDLKGQISCDNIPEDAK